jgi:hypothetical protein
VCKETNFLAVLSHLRDVDDQIDVLGGYRFSGGIPQQLGLGSAAIAYAIVRSIQLRHHTISASAKAKNKRA